MRGKKYHFLKTEKTNERYCNGVTMENNLEIIKELEEIKKDIIELNPDYEEDFKPFRIWSTDATLIIDKHISELKEK